MSELRSLGNEKVSELEYQVKVDELRDQLKVVNSDKNRLAIKVIELEDKLEDNKKYINHQTKKIADLERKVEELEPTGNANFQKRKV